MRFRDECNTEREHHSLGNLTPLEFKQKISQTRSAYRNWIFGQVKGSNTLSRCSQLPTCILQEKNPVDDSWNEVDSYIQLTPDYAEDCLAGLKDFSHLEVIYYFHKVDKSKIVCTSEHPRENNKWP